MVDFGSFFSITISDVFKAQSFVLEFSTYSLQLLTLAGLTQSQYAVQIDAGLFQGAVLNKAEGLKVKPGRQVTAVAWHRRPLIHRTASGKQIIELLLM